jgi:molybdate transport system substrate-binding protein
MRTRVSGAIAVAGLLATVALAQAGEVRVISAGAVKSIVTDLVPAYEKETGNKVVMEFGPMGFVRQKLASEPADVVIMSDTVLDDTIAKGGVVAGSRTDIWRTGMGVGVREGAPKPDISSLDAFKRALLEAKSIVYVDPASGATSGTHFAAVLQKLGLAEALKAKTRLVPGGYPAELVAKGEVDMVVHQISEIVPVKGVTLVGPLPKEIQKVTIYAAGLASKSANTGLARGFVAFLNRPDFRAKFAEAGLDYKD